MTASVSGPAGYIHSFSAVEQDRLIRQSRVLEPYIFPHIDFAERRRVLEIGCGVGAQIAILLRRWPGLHVTGVDRANMQLARARALLREPLAAGRTQLALAEGDALPFADAYFDGVFICWMLEHTTDPGAVLREVWRTLTPAGVFYCTEVFNSGLYLYPPCPHVLRYWEAFNRYQRELQGDPDVGMKLANLAAAAGFSRLELRMLSPMLDARMSSPGERSSFMDYWTDLFLSAAPALIAKNDVSEETVEQVKREMQALKTRPDGVFAYSAVQLRAVK